MNVLDLAKKEKPLLVRQDNLITEAGSDMTSHEKNLMYMWLIQLKDDDPEDKIYRIYVKDLEKITNTQINYSQLRNSFLEKFAKKFYSIKTDTGLEQFALLAAARYKKEGSVIELDIHPDIRKYFFGLKKQYTLFQFNSAIKLKSKYSKGIYEILSQFKGQYKKCLAYNKNIPLNSKEKWECIINISVQQLKQRFKLIDSKTGVDKYSNFGVFSQNVLKPAKKEIEEHTEISFECIPVRPKTGKKITNLQFKITNIEGIEELINLPESPPDFPKELSETTQPDTKSRTGLTPESPKMLSASIEAIPQIASLEKELCERCEIDPVLAKKVAEKGPEKEVRKLMNGLLKKQKAGEIESLGGYSTTIFRAWLNGAEPKFKKTDIQAKHIPLKSAGQTNQIAALQTEVQKKLSDFGLGRNTVYGLIVKYGAELETLKKLDNAISKVEKAIERKEIENNPDSIFEELNRQLNGEEKDFNQPLASESSERSNSTNSLGSLLASSISKPIVSPLTVEQEKISREKAGIWQELIGRFGINDEEANDLVEEYSPKALNHAISKVVEVLKNQTISQDPDSMIQELYKQLNLA